MKNKVSLFLDSGAYSAFTQNVTIDIQKYISFIKQNYKYIDFYANLDVLGDSDKTFQNQKIMEKAGLKPIPTFHQKEDYKYLRYYIEHYDYIALGGMVGSPSVSLRIWLDDVFSKFVCDENGYPKVKTHAFGLTSLGFLLRYPWYSADSTSWIMTGSFGSVFVPRIKRGEYFYNKDNWKIRVSNKSPSSKESGQHITTFSKEERKIIQTYFKDKGFVLGKSRVLKKSEDYQLKENESWFSEADNTGIREVERIIEPGLCNDYRLRHELNAIYFLDFEKSILEYPWAFRLKHAKGFGL